MGVLVQARAQRLAALWCVGGGRTIAVAGQEPAGQRAPGDDADALGAAQREHLALFLAIDEVVVVLHRDEPRPAPALGHLEHLRELPGKHARRADVARLAGPHDVVQRLEGLLDRGVRIEPVDLIEIDVIGPEAPQRGVDGVEQVLPGQAAVVRSVAHRKERLRGDHHLIARREVGQRASHDLFTDAAGIHVGGVEEVDAGVERTLDERAAGGLGQYPAAPRRRSEGHRAQAEARDPQPGPTEIHMVHGIRRCR